jgi:hypothetical protein
MGPFNWALFVPDPANLELFDAGSLSVGEMQTVLPEDQILAGLVRMGFGTGKFRRTKWISVWWVGGKVSAVKKGQVRCAFLDRISHSWMILNLTIPGFKPAGM